MFSKRKARLTVFAAAVVAVSSGLFLYMSPASTSVDPAAGAVRPSVASNPAITPWSEYLSEEAVDSAGVEKDLDGNASALISSASVDDPVDLGPGHDTADSDGGAFYDNPRFLHPVLAR